MVTPAETLRIGLFGHFSVLDTRGRSYLPRTRKTRAMLAIIAMASPKPILRAQLAALLWSRREKEQARASLRQSVHELQDALGAMWQHAFIADRHHVALRGPGLAIDARAIPQHEELSPELLSHYENILLEDLVGLDPAFDQWLEDERARVQRMAKVIGETLLAQCSDPADAINIAERLLRIDRRHEGAWRAMMRGHLDRGDPASAINTYDRLRSTLAELPEAHPSPETEELVSRIRHSVRTSDAPRMNPPPDRLPPDRLPSDRPSSDRGPLPGERSSLRLRLAPFRTIGDQPDQGLGAGLTEEISAGLSRFRWISCIPVSAWPPDDAAAPVQECDLLLEGTIQRVGSRVRVIVRLTDTRSAGEIVWADRFDRAFTDALSLQDELAAAIVAQVDPELMRHEGRRAGAGADRGLTARELVMQALPHMNRLDRDSFITARSLLEQAIIADPSSSVSHGWLAYWHLLYIGQGWAEDPDAATATAVQLAERAVTLDSTDARALTLAGHVRGFLGQSAQEACALHDRAIALNPNLALAWCFSGLAYAYLGRHEEALARTAQAVRLSPSDPHSFFYETAQIMPHLMLGDYAAAAEVGRRSVEINPQFTSALKGYLCALGWLGQVAEAASIQRRLLALEPGFCLQVAAHRSPLRRPEDVARYVEGLRRAGLPDTPASPQWDSAKYPIDLARTAQHSPAAVRDGSHMAGRVEHATTV